MTDFNQLDLGEVSEIPMENRPSISLLLGAGFSAPKGYPVGNSLNQKLLNWSSQTDRYKDGLYPERRLCQQMIRHYVDVQKRDFQYEEFYDYMRSEEGRDYIKEQQGELDKILTAYKLTVRTFIRDSTEQQWYGNNFTYVCDDEYEGFVNMLAVWSHDHIVNVHTLNHDLLFESFNQTSQLQNKISDGFDEVGSPYYGEYECGNERYTVRLARFTHEYTQPIRLYKLHGSLDYVLYRAQKDSLVAKPIKYVKIRRHVSYEKIRRELKDKHCYEQHGFTLQPDILVGTTSKTERYDDTLLYKILLGDFQCNLCHAEKLIIIGYSGGDDKINDYVMNNFDYKHKPVYIVATNPSDDLRQFAKQICATVIEKSVTDIEESDFVNK